MLLGDATGLMGMGMVFAALHECGHIIAIASKGQKISKINFGFANIDMAIKKDFHGTSVIILLAGCFVNFIFALIFGILYLYLQNAFIKSMAIQNIILGGINLLPITSFDGGQVLRLLCEKNMNPQLVKKFCDIISFVFFVPVCIAGFWIVLRSGYNFSLLMICIYVLSYIVFKEDIF